jgi:hypothetical protein
LACFLVVLYLGFLAVNYQWQHSGFWIQTARAIPPGERTGPRELAVEPQKLPAPPPRGASIAQLAQWIRPHSGEEAWLETGWLNRIDDAQRVARETNRLVFLWGTNQPAGRC